MANTNSNVRMFRNTGNICSFHKMCELTYFAVPFNQNPDYNEWALFSNELAANMFARSMHTAVVRDYKHVCIYK